MKKMQHNPKNKIVISAKNIYKSYKTKNKKIFNKLFLKLKEKLKCKINLKYLFLFLS